MAEHARHVDSRVKRAKRLSLNVLGALPSLTIPSPAVARACAAFPVEVAAVAPFACAESVVVLVAAFPVSGVNVVAGADPLVADAVRAVLAGFAPVSVFVWDSKKERNM
jgi:hypothetical protein